MSSRLLAREKELYTISTLDIASSINRSQKAINQLLSTCLGHHGLTLPEWTLLSFVSASPKTPTELARHMNVNISYVTQLVGKIKQNDNVAPMLIENSISSDTRSKSFSITNDGRQHLSSIEAMLQVCIRRELTQKLSVEELDTFFKVSNFIGQNVKHVEM